MARVRHRILVLLPLLVFGYAVVLFGALWLADDLATDSILAVGGMTVFTIVGALIEDRRPGNPLGRICLAVGLTLVASTALRIMAQRLDAEPGTLPPVGALLAVGSSFGFGTAMFLGQILVLSRFPDGRAPGTIGRLLDALLVLAIVLSTLNTLRPGRIQYGWIEDAPNPIGLDLLSESILEALSVAGFLIYFIALLAGFVTLLLRYRRGSSIARAQIRWFMAAASASAVLLVVVVTDALGSTGWDLWLLSTLLTPIAMGIAILRYRLFDIDRIISRTLSYAAVTAVLAATFVGANLLLSTLIASVTGGSTLAVAASTLLVAALFQPLRTLVQAPIDRRFNRAHIDAQRTLAAFGERLRDEMDLSHIGGAVVASADESLRPAYAGLWLRRAGR